MTEVTGQAPANPGTSTPEAAPSTTPPVAAAAPDAQAQQNAAPETPVIPEKYEFKAPEGIEFDTELLDQVQPLLKELGLTQDNASKLVTDFTKLQVKIEASREAAEETAFNEFMAKTAKDNETAIRTEWGTQFDANQAVAQRAIARFLSADAKAKMDKVGLGNDPEFMKTWLQVGKMIQEDSPPPNGQPTGRKSTESVLYPSMNS